MSENPQSVEEKAAEDLDREIAGSAPLKPPTVTSEVTALAKRLPAPIEAAKDGTLVGGTFEEQYRLARAYSASGLMPQSLDTPEKVLVAIQLCRELDLPPMTSMSKICVVNGSPSLFGDLPLALVMRSGKLEYIKEWFFDADGNELDQSKPLPDFFGACCTVKRKGQIEITRTFTKHDSVKAGSWGKRVWAVYPKRMMQMRTRSWALKDAFSDVLMGCLVAEYDHDTLIESGGGKPMRLTEPAKGSIADEINQEYLPDVEQAEAKAVQG